MKPIKIHRILTLIVGLLCLSTAVVGRPSKKPKTVPAESETETEPKKEEMKITNKEGGMVDSEKCPGVKCYHPSSDKNCTETYPNTPASLGSVPNPTANCCAIYVCHDGQNGQSIQYSASSGSFQSGPPPGFGAPPMGAPPGFGYQGPPPGFGYQGPPPGFGYQGYHSPGYPPSGFGYGQFPQPPMAGGQMPNYQYQQNSQAFQQKPPGSDSNPNSNSQSYSSSYSYSSGSNGNQGNNNTSSVSA